MLSKRIRRFLKLLRSPRIALSLLTALVLVLIIYLSRDELLKAWGLLGRANIWLLLLLIPFQIIVYFAGGEMIFSYLRDKRLIKHVSMFEQTRIALELNLVNHIFPSGGVSGISYTTWRMHKLGVNTARSTFAQLVRYITGFVSLMILLIVAVLILALDGQVNRYIVASSFLLVLIIVLMTFALIFMFSSRRRLHKTSKVITRLINTAVRWATLRRHRQFLDNERVDRFFEEMQDDFHELAADKKLIAKPLAWGAVYAIFDVAMFVVAFASLGAMVNPAMLLVGYGVAGLAGIFAFTPGGAGVYEAIMIIFLSMAGMPPDVAIAGIILTRVILLTGTIILGYVFYQHALIKYGKPHDSKIQR